VRRLGLLFGKKLKIYLDIKTVRLTLNLVTPLASDFRLGAGAGANTPKSIVNLSLLVPKILFLNSETGQSQKNADKMSGLGRGHRQNLVGVYNRRGKICKSV